METGYTKNQLKACAVMTIRKHEQNSSKWDRIAEVIVDDVMSDLANHQEAWQETDALEIVRLVTMAIYN